MIWMLSSSPEFSTLTWIIPFQLNHLTQNRSNLIMCMCMTDDRWFSFQRFQSFIIWLSGMCVTFSMPVIWYPLTECVLQLFSVSANLVCFWNLWKRQIGSTDLLTDAMRQKTHIHTHTHRYTVQTYTNVLTTKKNYHSFRMTTRPSIESATIYGWVICVCIFSISNRDLLRRKSKMECFIPIENTHAFIYMYAVWVWYVLCILHT